MNKLAILCIFSHLLSIFPLQGGGLPNVLQVPQEGLFTDILDQKRQLLEEIDAEIKNFETTQDDFVDDSNNKIEVATRQVAKFESLLSEDTTDSFLVKVVGLSKNYLRLLKDIAQTRQNVNTLLSEFGKLLRQFFEDSDAVAFKKEHNLQDRLYYSFDDLYHVHSKISGQESLVNQLIDQEKCVQTEKDNRKKYSQTIVEEHTSEQAELQELRAASTASLREQRIDREHVETAIRLEEDLFNTQKEYAALRIKEIQWKLSFVQTKIFIEKMHLDLMRRHFRSVKSSIKINESDVLDEQDIFAQEKNKYLERKEQYQTELNEYETTKKQKKTELEELSKVFGIALGHDLDEWSRQPSQTVGSFVSLGSAATLNSLIAYIQEEINQVEAKIVHEDQKFHAHSILVKAKWSYYRIVNRQFFGEEEIAQEIKYYEAQKNEMGSIALQYKDKISSVAEQLSQQKAILDNIKAWRVNLESQENIFKDNRSDYEQLIEQIEKSQEHIQKKVDILGQLTGIYSGIIAEANNIIRIADFLIGELQSITIWYRPEYAITWQGLKNIGIDVTVFLSSLHSYVMRFDERAFFEPMKNFFDGSMKMFLFLLKIFVLISICLLFKWYLPQIISAVVALAQRTKGMLRFILLLIGLICTFINKYFIALFCWGMGTFLLFHMVTDVLFFSLLYLLSIPYLLYLAHRLMHTIVQFNTQYNYALLSSDFQNRFIIIVSTLLYATITIEFFRHAFMLSSYYHSELPTILLAINFIIFQIALIFLISKEQILRIIPTENMIWLWIRDRVDKYFYLILLFVIAIIVMSNPYIGFGRLVFYLVSKLLYMVLIFKLFVWGHNSVKRMASYMFFFTEEDVARERFSHARTWFGLLIIASFLIFSFLATIIIAKIWGWPIRLHDILVLLNRPIFLEKTTTPVSLVALLQIIGFIMLGFVIAYAINKFVLNKIFDLLQIDTGVQHATTRFTQYLIVMMAVALGFRSVGLDNLINWIIGAFLLGIGWYIREPIGDLIAYFIILVQRPIKIGDFVKIDVDILGVVQKITARSVIIRRKNSTTIVIPNSHIISKSIVNWNYVRNFIAFDDIIIVVDYKEDAERVKELLFEIVCNHPQILRNPKPIVRLDGFGESGYEFMVRGFISSVYTLDMWDIASSVRLSITRTLQENNIKIALPVRVIAQEDQSTNI